MSYPEAAEPTMLFQLKLDCALIAVTAQSLPGTESDDGFGIMTWFGVFVKSCSNG